jgi:uncharacterized membrane protein|tara:strand:- start:756 stop:3311 length:2556 start_codon:yes stop_codon:yes gene_type:complete
MLIVWTPASGEEVVGQEQDISLYLYSDNGIGKLHTMESGNHGDTDQVNIQPGSSIFFALNYSLQADLLAKSYRSDIGFHIYLYANSADWNAAHLNIFVRDGTTMTNGELVASGDINIPTALQSSNEVHVDVPWEEDYGPEYTFDMEHFIVLELENDGTNAVNLELDTGKSGDSPSRLITNTNPVTDVEIITESYNLETSDTEDKKVTDNFNPNLPSEISKMFVSGQALNAFGTYDITSFSVIVFDSGDNELFQGQIEVDEPEENTGTNNFEDILWNYNDPAEPSENHNGKGIYTVQVSAIDQQGNEFSLDKTIEMDAYGIYLSTPEPQQSVAVGGIVEYSLFVLNSGDETDTFLIEPSETSDNWIIDPESATSSSLSPGSEQVITFTIAAADSTDMVGKSTVVIFTAKSQNSVEPVNFDLETKTSVGAEYEISLYFDDPNSGQAVSSLSINGVAGEWNQYSLSIANQGQATDDVQLLAQSVPADWEIKFEYNDLEDGSIVVEGIPRSGDGVNVINVTVWAKPAQGGDIETANIQLIGISQGNTTKSDTAVLSLTRTFGLSLSVTPQGTSGIFLNKQAGEQFEIDLLLDCAIDGDHSIRLYVSDELPNGWSYAFKENGNTIDDIDISKGESKPIDLLITVGSQAIYNVDGDSFDVLAAKIGDDTVNARQPITVILKLTDGFDLSSLKFKANLEPSDSFTFQLNIENSANGDDKFTLSATSVPSGWRVIFPNGNIFDIGAGRTQVIPIQVTVGDDARNGDEESITISIVSQLSNIERQQSFVVEVEQGFTDRLVSAFSDLWYVFVFLGLILTISFVTYSRSEGEDWEEYDEEDTSVQIEETKPQSGDDWDDWN